MYKWEMRNPYKILVGKPKGGNYFKHLGIALWIMLQLKLNKVEGCALELSGLR
jgi:hypothetical protein